MASKKIKIIFSYLGILALLCFFFLGCAIDHLQRSSSVRASQDSPVEEEQKTKVETEVLDVATAQKNQLQAILPQSDIKLGLILGPGSLKSFAQIGVLHALEEANISIHALVGLEWGAMVAGIYAHQGQVNDVEWQMFKLKEELLPQKGLLSSSIRATSVERLDEFFEETTKNKKMSDNKIIFGCPIINIRHEKVKWIERGSLANAVKKCVSFPPYFMSHKGEVAGAFALKESAEWLRSKGANLIVFVNVIEQGVFFDRDRIEDEYKSQLIWMLGRELLKKQRVFVDELWGMYTRNDGLIDFEARRDLVIQGKEVGSRFVMELKSKYGL